MRNRAMPSRVYLLFVCVLTTLLPTSVTAQTGQITGTVSDELAAPAAGLTVQLEDPFGSYLADTTTAAGTGTYAFTGLADGDYLVKVFSDPGMDLVGEYYDGVNEFDTDLATPVTVSGGATVANVDFVLSPGGSISGSVSNLAMGETVNLQAYDATSQRYRGGFDSDAGFGYTLESLPAGTYTIFAETEGTDRALQWWDGKIRQSAADTVSVAADQDVTGIDFTLTAGTSISGTVSLSPDPGDAGATVQQMWIGAFDPSSSEHVKSRSPDAAGSFTLDNLPPGSYGLQANAHQTGYVSEIWVTGADVPGQPPVFDFNAAEPIASPATGVDFLLEEGRSISGHVFLETLIENGVQDPGEPDAAGANVYAGHLTLGFGNGTQTDADGDYTVVGLVAGSYNVQVESGSVAVPFVTELWDDKTQFEIPDVVDVTLADATGIDFDVIQRQVISGKVFLDFDGDQVQDAGEPGFSNVTVRATRDDGFHAGHAAVGSDGSFSIGLLPGTYTLEAEPHQPGLLREHWNDVFFIEEAQPIDITGGDASGIDFGLLASATVGTLRGRVTAADTLLGIPNVGVEVWRADDGAYVAGATTDANGDYLFSDLPPSPAAGYKVWLRTDAANEAGDSDYVSSFWSASGDPGSIDPNDLRVTFPTLPDPPGGPGTDLGSFELAVGGSISGTVFPPGGQSLPEYMTVDPQSFESGGAPLPGATVDAGGAYRIRGLPAPATYRVQAGTYGTDFVPVYYLTAAESTFDYNTAAPVDVDVDLETAGIDLHLELGGSISGTITRESDGSPVAYFPVSVHLDQDPFGRGFWAGVGTEPDGTYHLRGLPSGSYEVRTDGRDTDLANESYPSLVAVTAPGETAGIDFALAAAGRIRGRVTQIVDMVTEPVVNMRVEATDFASGQFLSDGYTDAAGDYLIGSLPQGSDYRLRVATQDGNDPQFFNFVSEYYDDQILYETADPVTVPVDPGGGVSEVLGIDFDLALGGVISGVVTDGGGSPLQAVWVQADDFAGTSFGNGDLTDQNGVYFVRGLPAGSYRVRADPYPLDFVGEYFDDTYDYNLATPVSVAAVPPGGPIPITGNIDFGLADAFKVSGVVTEADGVTPIAGLPMSANGLDVATGGWGMTLGDGSYEIGGLPAGRYQVVTETDGTSFIRQEQEVDLSAGSVSGVDFALEAGASISGRTYEDLDSSGTYDPGEEQADVAVTAYDFFTGEWIASATSGAGGSYQIQGLGAGSYRLEIEPDERNFIRQYWDDVFRYDQATPVEIVDGAGLRALIDVAGIDFRLVRGLEIRGLVFFDPNDDGIRQGGEPALSNLSVNADHDSEPVGAWGQTELDGTYVLHGVLPGQYKVYVHAQGTPYASELYRLVGGLPVGTFRFSEADVIDVSGGDATGIDLSLVLGGGVTGTVIDASTSMPLANVDVYLNDFGEDGLGFGNRSGSDGRYLIDGLPPGSYRVSTYDSQGVYVGEFHQDALYYEDALPVAVVARSSVDDPLATSIDFDLDQGGAIAGLIYHDQNENGVRDGGEPALGGIDVRVEEHAEPHRWITSAVTLADGTYRLGGLPPGLDLRLAADAHPTDFLGVFYDGGDDLGSPDGNDAVALSVTSGGTLTGLDFGLLLGGSIRGQVVDGDGVPIAGTWVNAAPFAAGNGGGGDFTAADGSYTLHAILAGDYRVNAGGDPYRFEYWDDQTQYNAADPVSVTGGAATPGIDFVLPLEPRIVSGPDPAFGDRDTTVVGVTVTVENAAPGALLELGGGGVTIQNLVVADGTFTFDVAIAADATLGKRSLSVINDHLLEDAADVLADAFEVRPGATGPAASAERLYVADNATARIRVYGTADFSFLGTVDLCCQPGDVAVSPDGSFVYAVGGDRTLSVIDARLGTVGEEVARLIPESVGDLAVSDDYLYTNDNFLQVVHYVDVSTWEIAGQIAVGASPTALALNPAGDVLWVANRDDDSLSLIDADAASPTLHQVLATVPLPAGTSPRGLAFTPSGAHAWIVGWQETYVVDAALALSDPANALLHTLATPGSGRGLIDVAFHAASGKDLAYLRASGDRVWVVDASAPQPQVLRTFNAGYNIAGIRASGDRLYLIHDASHDLYAVDVAELLSSPALSMTRFDGPEAPGGPVTPSGGAAVAVPGAAPAAPTVTVTGGSPAVNGSPFTVTLGGSGFAADAVVWLRGTLVRGTVTNATATSLTVDFPALTPAGDRSVVVTNPAPGGGASGFSSNTLQVTPPAGFTPTQEVYATSYGTGRITVFEPGGTTGEIFPQPYPSGISITPDGRLAFVGQLYWGPETPEQLADNALDVTVVDLDPDSPTYRQVVATVPYAMSNFSAPAITPEIDNPNGVFAYMPNSYFDTVTVIDGDSLTEVDVDGDPGTESIPPYFFPGKLDGITRIELDGQVYPSDLGPNETALTPDGTLLYVVDRNARVSIVDAVTWQVVGELFNGGDFGQLRGVVTDGTYVYVSGDDGAGVPHLFAFQAGVLDDSAFLLKTPITERPSGTALSADGDTVFMTARFAGVLMIADVSQIGSLQMTVQDVPIANGLFEVVEASEDQLLWVTNIFQSAIHIVDLAPGPGQYSVVTTLGAPVCSLHMAVPPVLDSSVPVVGGVSPSSGDLAGGDPVVVTGANFEPGATVRFGTNLATGVTVMSSFAISAVTPASTTGAGPVDVTVENPGGQSDVLAGGFTYAQDLTPPVFTVPPYVASQAVVGDPPTVTAEIRWTTDEASTSVVDYRQVGAPVFDQASTPGLVKSHVVMLTGLRGGSDMEFRATSADAQGNVNSSPAAPAVATFTTLSVPDTTPPIIVSGPMVAAVTTSSVQVQWTTDETSTSIVQFDAVLDDGNFDRQAFGAGGTSHSVALTGLASATTHEYKVISVDPSGNLVESPKMYFNTAAGADVTPPVVTAGPAVSYLSNDLVIVTWETDESSTSFVNYGTAAVDEQSVVDVDLVQFHVVFLTNLLPGTAYGYQFGSTDADGNTVLSADPFDALARPRDPRTLGAPLRLGGVVLGEGSTLTVLGASEGFTTADDPDTSPPEVLSVTVTPLSFDRVLIAAATDEAASLGARYGLGGLDNQAFAPSFTLTPNLVIAGLAGDSTYQLSLELRDPGGNVATVADLEFATPAAPDVQAPVITGLTVTALTATTARVQWQTDEPADGTVLFGVAGGALDRQAGLLGLRTVHGVLLSGLAPGTAYDFQAVSRDASGNLGLAAGGFTTLTAAPVVTSLTPTQAVQGTAVEIAVNGANFGFDSTVAFGPGIAVEVLSVNQIGTRIQVAVSVSLAAAPGQRPVTVTTGGRTATAAFTVLDAGVIFYDGFESGDTASWSSTTTP